MNSAGVPSATFNPVKDLPDMKGKVVIVTGSRCGVVIQRLLTLG